MNFSKILMCEVDSNLRGCSHLVNSLTSRWGAWGSMRSTRHRFRLIGPMFFSWAMWGNPCPDHTPHPLANSFCELVGGCASGQDFKRQVGWVQPPHSKAAVTLVSGPKIGRSDLVTLVAGNIFDFRLVSTSFQAGLVGYSLYTGPWEETAFCIWGAV